MEENLIEFLSSSRNRIEESKVTIKNSGLELRYPKLKLAFGLGDPSKINHLSSIRPFTRSILPA